MRKTVFEPVKAELEKQYGVEIPYMYGSMVECVRAALTAKKLATESSFFSFGTNDLTQGTFSYYLTEVHASTLTSRFSLPTHSRFWTERESAA